jgi:hypothetical protein
VSRLEIITLVCGAVFAVTGLVCVLMPGRARAWMRAFPRSRSAGWFFTAVDLLWSAWLLYVTPLGRFDEYKPALLVLAPIAFVLVVWLMDELLAPRALGGLLLLLPSPMLDAARWHASTLRLVPVVLAYVFVLAGIVLVLSPYRFRKTVSLLSEDDLSCRACGGFCIAWAAFLVVLALKIL